MATKCRSVEAIGLLPDKPHEKGAPTWSGVMYVLPFNYEEQVLALYKLDKNKEHCMEVSDQWRKTVDEVQSCRTR